MYLFTIHKGINVQCSSQFLTKTHSAQSSYCVVKEAVSESDDAVGITNHTLESSVGGGW